ncbi:hypothetical protein SZ39_5892 [Bacillus mycoides]|nr:hypothetical protein SZ39_5892 [Bacillus mycoides]
MVQYPPPIPPFTLPTGPTGATGPTVLTQEADPFYILKTFWDESMFLIYYGMGLYL